MRPTFRIQIAGPLEDAIKRLRVAMTRGDLGRHADAAGSCLDFRIAPAERRFWSPHLSIQLSSTDQGVELFGRFSPRPEVWTFVMMLYFGAAFVAIGGGLYGCAQTMLGDTPWALGAIPASLAAMLGLHLVSLAGQRLSQDQMANLRDRLDRVLAEALEEGGIKSETQEGEQLLR
jgi:hypothetical protein